MNDTRTKWILPLIVAGALLGVIGTFTLINRFQGGFMSEGLLRHACWMIIALTLAGSVGCFCQAVEWKRALTDSD